MMNDGWYTVVSSGGAMATAYPTDWPRGPWKSEAEAEAALDRWVERRDLDSEWGTIQAAHNIRVVGPFRTRAIARQADISDYHRHIER